MHLQVLGSGSKGNASLVRAGDTHLLVDAGLTLRELDRRLGDARVSPGSLDHIALTHGHLDHARSAGGLAKRTDARIACCEALMSNASIHRAPRMATLRIGTEHVLEGPRGDEGLRLTAVKIPHDADPTVAFRLEHQDRVAVFLTDIGIPDHGVARKLRGAHVLVLEFNHDTERLRNGPYPDALKRRVASAGGHLSNAEAAGLLPELVGDELHTLVLAHLSETNNTPELATAAAGRALAALGREDVAILVGDQYEIGPNLAV